MPPPTTSNATPAATSVVLATFAPELVGLRARGRVGRNADLDVVRAGLDRDVLRDRRLAALAPRVQLVLARREVLEREVAGLVGDDVRRRVDDDDVRRHRRVQVATEPDDALFGERVLARLADLVDAEIERRER